MSSFVKFSLIKCQSFIIRQIVTISSTCFSYIYIYTYIYIYIYIINLTAIFMTHAYGYLNYYLDQQPWNNFFEILLNNTLFSIINIYIYIYIYNLLTYVIFCLWVVWIMLVKAILADFGATLIYIPLIALKAVYDIF